MDKTIEYQLNIILCVRRMNKKELMKMVGNHKEIVNQYLEGKVSEEELKNTIGLYQTYIVNTYKGQFSCQEFQEMLYLKDIMDIHITYDIYHYIANKLKETGMCIREMEVSELYELANNYMKIFCSDKIYLLKE